MAKKKNIFQWGNPGERLSECVEGVEIYKINLKKITYPKIFMQRIIQKRILKVMPRRYLSHFDFDKKIYTLPIYMKTKTHINLVSFSLISSILFLFFFFFIIFLNDYIHLEITNIQLEQSNMQCHTFPVYHLMTSSYTPRTL